MMMTDQNGTQPRCDYVRDGYECEHKKKDEETKAEKPRKQGW